VADAAEESPPEEPQRLPVPSAWAKTELDALGEDKSGCASRVGYVGELEDCHVALTGAGNGLIVTLVTECGGDSCSTKRWLLKEGSPSALPLSEDGGGIAFEPHLAFYVADHRQFANEQDMRQNFYQRAMSLFRYDLGARAARPFAHCFSPSLSPGGNWFLCRNPHGDLFRIPVRGGKLERVAVNRVQGQVAFSPYAFIYPSEAYFYSEAQACFRSGGDPDDEEICVPWSEGKLSPSVTQKAQ
jgi:hypothetical protein